MPSEQASATAALEADLFRELRARGIRGRYARRLVAEWADHFRNLTEAMPVEQALSRLGAPADLAQAAACEHFDRRWWWGFPVTAGILWGLLAYVTAMGYVCLPVLASLCGWTSMTSFTWYDSAFNWAGPVLIFMLLWWISGNVSSPPVCRKSMLVVLGVLLGLTVMGIQLPEGYVPGSGKGSFTLGLVVAPDSESRSASIAWWMLSFRVILIGGLLLWCLPSSTRRRVIPFA